MGMKRGPRASSQPRAVSGPAGALGRQAETCDMIMSVSVMCRALHPAYGAWGPSAVKLFASLAKDKSNATGETKNMILRQLFQHLGILLHRANARAVLRRCMPRSAAVYPVLSVAAELQCPAAGAEGL